MALTQSGFEVIDSYGDPALIANPVVPGTADVKILGGLRAGDVATVLLYVAARWHAEVEPLVQSQGQWGYEKRTIVGGTGVSNHAGGCAEDLNAAVHPRSADTMSDTTKAKIRQIIAYTNTLGGETVVDWGGEWRGVTLDQMHVQITGDVNRFALFRAAQKIRGEIPPPKPPAPTPQPPQHDDLLEWIMSLPGAPEGLTYQQLLDDVGTAAANRVALAATNYDTDDNAQKTTERGFAVSGNNVNHAMNFDKSKPKK